MRVLARILLIFIGNDPVVSCFALPSDQAVSAEIY